MQMDLNVQASGGGSETMQVSDAVFAAEFNESLIHQVVTAYMAASRSGTKAHVDPVTLLQRWPISNLRS